MFFNLFDNETIDKNEESFNKNSDENENLQEFKLNIDKEENYVVSNNDNNLENIVKGNMLFKNDHMDEDELEIDDVVSNDASGNILNSNIKFKKYSFRDIEKIIEENYFEKNHRYSSSLDILAT